MESRPRKTHWAETNLWRSHDWEMWGPVTQPFLQNEGVSTDEEAAMTPRVRIPGSNLRRPDSGLCKISGISGSSELLCMLSRFSHTRLFVTPWTVAHQVPLFMGSSRQEYRSGLPFPSPRNLPDWGIDKNITWVSYVSCIGRWVLYH